MFPFVWKSNNIYVNARYGPDFQIVLRFKKSRHFGAVRKEALLATFLEKLKSQSSSTCRQSHLLPT